MTYYQAMDELDRNMVIRWHDMYNFKYRMMNLLLTASSLTVAKNIHQVTASVSIMQQ